MNPALTATSITSALCCMKVVSDDSSTVLGNDGNLQPFQHRRFFARHWQQVKPDAPITVTALLDIREVFEISMPKLVQGLDAEGVYEKLEPVLPQRRRRRS